MSEDQKNLKQGVNILRAINHPLRKQILEFIDAQKITNVNNIYNTLNLEQSVTSQHLRILRQAQLVDAKREGKKIYYTVNHSRLEKYKKAIEKYASKLET